MKTQNTDTEVLFLYVSLFLFRSLSLLKSYIRRHYSTYADTELKH